MTRLKLKSSAKRALGIAVVVLLFLSIGLYSFIKIKSEKDYEKTYDYKLSTKGYNENDINLLKENYKDKEINYILEQDKNDIYTNILKDKMFIYNNFYDYLDYYSNNSTLSVREIVEKVNTKTNNAYYENSEQADTSKKELMLVNKYYYLDESYTPENIVSIPTTYAWGNFGDQQVTQSTYDAFLNLWNASHEAGFYLMVNSSYRTFEKQQSVYDEGYSEHQTGYSIDIFEKGYSKSNFSETDSYKWLLENAHNYGFILRYPEDKVDITGYDFESWHFRYVGVEAATYIYENNITFDEYYAYFVK